MITEREIGVLLSVHVTITTTCMPQSRRSLLGLEGAWLLAVVDSFLFYNFQPTLQSLQYQPLYIFYPVHQLMHFLFNIHVLVPYHM